MHMMDIASFRRKAMEYLSVMRIDHWVKNVFYVSGAAFAVFLTRSPFTATQAQQLAITFVVLGLIASANYILNEIIDSPFDRLHPVKKHRAVPSQKVSVPVLYLIQIALLVAALFVADRFLPRPILFVALSFFVSGLIYNVRPIRLKDIPVIDVITESVNNPIRFLAGWYVITTSTPPMLFLLSFWALGAFWMAGKRYGELVFLKESQSDVAGYRKSLAFYNSTMLLALLAASCAVFFAGYTLAAWQWSPKLFIALPFLILYFCWYYRMILHNHVIVREPESFLTHTPFLAYNVFLSGLFFVMMFVWV